MVLSVHDSPMMRLRYSEKMSSPLTEDYLEQETKLGHREDFERFMKKVPDVEPEDYDRL